METLFKFAHIRPAIEQSEDTPSIKLADNTPFQQALSQARAGRTVRADMKAVARQYVASVDFVADPENLRLGDRLKTFSGSLDRLERANAVDNAAVQGAVRKDLGTTPANVIRSRDFTADISRLRDSIIAIKLLPEEHQRPLHTLTSALRDLELIRHTVDEQKFPQSPRELRRYRRRSLALPQLFGLGSVLGKPRDDDGGRGRKEADDHRKHFDALLERFRSVTTAVDELARITGHHLVQTPTQSSSKFLPPAALRPIALFEHALKQGMEPTQTALLSNGPSVFTRGEFMGKAVTEGAGEKGTFSATAPARVVGTLVTPAAGLRTTFTGRPAFRPADVGAIGFRLTDTASAALSKGTRAVLEEHGLRITAQPLDEVVDSLRAEVRLLSATLDEVAGRGVQQSFKRIGNTMVMISTPIATPWTGIVFGAKPGSFFPVPAPPPDTRIPHSHGKVAPVGVADLIIVKQQLVRYEATDVAHIENVLQGERKFREHRRRRETEELTFRETEVTTSEERDLESTDRFEMTRETSETIREEASLKAGLTVSGKYGPTVEFSASAEGALSRTKEQATKAASTFSKEITQRSATKITERILERESLRVTTEVEDKNEHTLDNVGGGGHIRGIYQWVEKVYEAQMFNYGLRTMFDFTVPEPGAFLIEALRRAHASAVELEKPIAFTLRSDEITEYNYHTWVQEYGATDVEPPPEPYRTKSIDYGAGGGDERTDYQHSGQVQIDEGYQAIHASVGVVGMIWDDNYVVDVVVGQRTHRFEDADWLWTTSLDNERDSVPFALATFNKSSIAVAAEIKCQRTDRAMAKWRHDTHAKLTQAYRARLAEYDEKLAALRAEAGIAIQGQSPATNQELMKDELKKACISILTEQHYDLFDAIENGSNGLPQVDLFENEGEGPYVRFFEQAFEWEHVTWVTYPYFWGRKSEWTNRVAFEDADPLFNQFLKAGYCRVVVPVREGFEGAVDHFMTFGEPWVGGPLPPISSPLYLPIADELAERLDRPGDEVPEGDPWEVRLPTSLVRLRDDGSLPSWRKDAQGNWVPQ
jgi:hypothetical protein